MMYAEKRFDVEIPPVKPKPSLGGLIAWLRTKPSHGRYDFDDLEGQCLMGQYMAHCGIVWDSNSINYYRTVKKTFPDYEDSLVLATHPWTFGAALKRAQRAIDRLAARNNKPRSYHRSSV
jgi:hypothetical protein